MRDFTVWQSKARSASLCEFFFASKFDVSGQCSGCFPRLHPPDKVKNNNVHLDLLKLFFLGRSMQFTCSWFHGAPAEMLGIGTEGSGGRWIHLRPPGT